MKRSNKILISVGITLMLVIVFTVLFSLSNGDSEESTVEFTEITDVAEVKEVTTEEASSEENSEDTTVEITEKKTEKATKLSVNNLVVSNDTYEEEQVVIVADVAKYSEVIDEASRSADEKAKELASEIPTEATKEVDVDINNDIDINAKKSTNGTNNRGEGKYSQLHASEIAQENSNSSEA